MPTPTTFIAVIIVLVMILAALRSIIRSYSDRRSRRLDHAPHSSLLDQRDSPPLELPSDPADALAVLQRHADHPNTDARSTDLNSD